MYDESDLLLAIESSCDETAAAVIQKDLVVRSHAVTSQIALHETFGGVVPEIASRAHVASILPVIDQALADARVTLEELSAVAVVTEPGLVGSLLVGLTAAKAICLTQQLPLIPVNHVEAHLYACRMSAGADVFPATGLVVSGGHTSLYDCRGPLDFRLVGSTIDDAAGEAFDKAAQQLGLGYPGGPEIERVARDGQPDAVRFPRPLLQDPGLDFSFSGLKTAMRYQVQGVPGAQGRAPVEELTDRRRADLAASFQAAVVDVLVARARRAVHGQGYQRLLVGGGVAANGALRHELERMCHETGAQLHVAPVELCTDNAAMGAIGWERLAAGQTASLDCDVTPGLVRRR